MEARPDLPDALVVPTRMHPVGEQHDLDSTVEVDPDRRTGEPEMPHRVWSEAGPRARMLRRRGVPAERPGRARNRAGTRPALTHERRRQEIVVPPEARMPARSDRMHVR